MKRDKGGKMKREKRGIPGCSGAPVPEGKEGRAFIYISFES